MNGDGHDTSKDGDEDEDVDGDDEGVSDGKGACCREGVG